MRNVAAVSVGVLSERVKHGVAAAMLGLVLLGEPITRRVAVGGFLIIAGVYAIETHSREPQAEQELA